MAGGKGRNPAHVQLVDVSPVVQEEVEDGRMTVELCGVCVCVCVCVCVHSKDFPHLFHVFALHKSKYMYMYGKLGMRPWKFENHSETDGEHLLVHTNQPA